MKAIAEAEGDPGAIDLIEVNDKHKIREITVNARNDEHARQIVEAVDKLRGVNVLQVSDRVFEMHQGGKIRIRNTVPVNTRDALSMAYTPGVARVCMAIAEEPHRDRELTIKKNAVAVVSDGSAVLGLGNIGPAAAMPVMEGKAMLFKEFADIDAYPICLDTTDPQEIILATRWIAPGFGAINLEDISAPRCFQIEEELKRELQIPVFHDDQHGTAVVVLAGLINALKITKQKLGALKIVIIGAGAAGVAVTKFLKVAGARQIICCDRQGILCRDRLPNLNFSKQWIVNNTNPQDVKGSIAHALVKAHVLIGVSGPGLVSSGMLRKMAKNPIVFAMANPVPEIMPEDAQKTARIIATGRSDYPNQINNVLGFPGIFRGALDSGATDINEPMKIAAAKAIAACITKKELSEDYIIPSVLNTEVVPRVARAVAAAAIRSGAAPRQL